MIKYILKSHGYFKSALLVGAVFFAAFVVQSVVLVDEAHACGSCEAFVRAWDDQIWQEAEDEFDEKLDAEFKALQRFIVHQMWEQSILPVMMLSAEQLTAFAIQQAMAIGMFIDAESQMDAQRMLQEIRAQAHKDYHPTEGMCVFGSLMKGIATTERKGEILAVVMAQKSQDRQLGQENTSGMYGHDLDQEVRIIQFRERFCKEKDRGSSLIKDAGSSLLYACWESTDWADASFDVEARGRIDKDIDYFSLVDSPWSMKLDFTNNTMMDSTATPPIDNRDEEYLMAMASNLFGHQTFPRIPTRLIENRPDRELTEMQKAYLDMRSIVAKRSVAENSLYAIASMKAQGHRVEPPGGPPTVPQSSRVYMEHILKELGVPVAEIVPMLGEDPSYYAQMEILTKKLYQNPDFYTNLYDKPANVARKTVSMQAIKLMQKFDMLKSSLRGEATMSILLELAVIELQREIEDQIQAITGQ